MALREITIIEEPDPSVDDGWEAVEEAHCKRRTSRRRLGSGRRRTSDRDDDRRQDDRLSDDRREDEATRRLLFGGDGYHGLGAVLLAIGLLIVASAYFGPSWSGRGGDFADRPIPVGARDRVDDHDMDYAVAYDDYARRYALNAERPELRYDRGPWMSDTMGWGAGGVLLLIGVVVLGAALSRSAFAGPLDD